MHRHILVTEVAAVWFGRPQTGSGNAAVRIFIVDSAGQESWFVAIPDPKQSFSTPTHRLVAMVQTPARYAEYLAAVECGSETAKTLDREFHKLCHASAVALHAAPTQEEARGVVAADAQLRSIVGQLFVIDWEGNSIVGRPGDQPVLPSTLAAVGPLTEFGGKTIAAHVAARLAAPRSPQVDTSGAPPRVAEPAPRRVTARERFIEDHKRKADEIRSSLGTGLPLADLDGTGSEKQINFARDIIAHKVKELPSWLWDAARESCRLLAPNHSVLPPAPWHIEHRKLTGFDWVAELMLARREVASLPADLPADSPFWDFMLALWHEVRADRPRTRRRSEHQPLIDWLRQTPASIPTIERGLLRAIASRGTRWATEPTPVAWVDAPAGDVAGYALLRTGRWLHGTLEIGESRRLVRVRCRDKAYLYCTVEIAAVFVGALTPAVSDEARRMKDFDHLVIDVLDRVWRDRRSREEPKPMNVADIQLRLPRKAGLPLADGETVVSAIRASLLRLQDEQTIKLESDEQGELRAVPSESRRE